MGNTPLQILRIYNTFKLSDFLNEYIDDKEQTKEAQLTDEQRKFIQDNKKTILEKFFKMYNPDCNLRVFKSVGKNSYTEYYKEGGLTFRFLIIDGGGSFLFKFLFYHEKTISGKKQFVEFIRELTFKKNKVEKTNEFEPLYNLRKIITDNRIENIKQYLIQKKDLQDKFVIDFLKYKQKKLLQTMVKAQCQYKQYVE